MLTPDVVERALLLDLATHVPDDPRDGLTVRDTERLVELMLPGGTAEAEALLDVLAWDASAVPPDQGRWTWRSPQALYTITTLGNVRACW